MKKLFNKTLLLSSILFTTAATVFGKPATDEQFRKDLLGISQDPYHFIQDQVKAEDALVDYDPKKVMKSYLSHYFAPWINVFSIIKLEEIKKKIGEELNYYLRKPGWNSARQPHTEKWASQLANQVHLANFPNSEHAAVVIKDTDLRILPYAGPSFEAWNKPGRGYPFDRLQNSYLRVNEPVYVLHTTHNGAWKFVISSEQSWGWIKSNDIAKVTPEFIKKWRTGKYLTPNQDKICLHHHTSGDYTTTMHLGQLFPLSKDGGDAGDYYLVYTAGVDDKGFARIVTSRVKKEVMDVMPRIATEKNIVMALRAFLGESYGWGGMNGLRDCTATLRDLWAPFGIFLPRQSEDIGVLDEVIPLKSRNVRVKEAQIIKEAKPLLTLLWMNNHVMLYVGHVGNRAYIFNNLWGYRTCGRTEGRAVIGKSVILPLDFTERYNNINKPLLTKITKMLPLTKRLTSPIMLGQETRVMVPEDQVVKPIKNKK